LGTNDGGGRGGEIDETGVTRLNASVHKQQLRRGKSAVGGKTNLMRGKKIQPKNRRQGGKHCRQGTDHCGKEEGMKPKERKATLGTMCRSDFPLRGEGDGYSLGSPCRGKGRISTGKRATHGA